MIRTACAFVITPSVVPTIQVADAPSRLAYGKHLEKAQSLAIPAINPLAKASPAQTGRPPFPYTPGSANIHSQQQQPTLAHRA